MPVANLGDLVVTTARHYSKTIADNVTTNNALLYKLQQKGRITEKTGGGRVLDEYIMYGSNNSVQFYDGYDTFTPPTSDQQVIDAAEFSWKQQGGFVAISGREEAMNSGEYQLKDLLEARLNQLDANLQNAFATSLYSLGTGSGGKELTGLQAAVADNPAAAGTYGGINQVTFPFWRNYTSGTLTLSATNIQAAMNAAYLATLRGKDQVDLILADNSMYTFYWTSLQTNQRFTQAETGKAGFTSLKFQAADVIYDAVCTAKRMYFLNTDYLKFRYAPDRWFKTGKQREIQNADYIVVPIWTMGNLVCNQRARQGVIIDD